MANTTRYVTRRQLFLVDLRDESGSLTIDAETLVTVEEEPITVRGASMKVFTVLTGPHTSKEFVIETCIFDESFKPVHQAEPEGEPEDDYCRNLHPSKCS